MGAGLKPAGAALRSHTAKNPETDASGAKNGILKGLNPCQNPKNPSKCRAERLAVSNCAVVQQPARAIAPESDFRRFLNMQVACVMPTAAGCAAH
jgi:hypothetical protein